MPSGHGRPAGADARARARAARRQRPGGAAGHRLLRSGRAAHRPRARAARRRPPLVRRGGGAARRHLVGPGALPDRDPARVCGHPGRGGLAPRVRVRRGVPAGRGDDVRRAGPRRRVGRDPQRGPLRARDDLDPRPRLGGAARALAARHGPRRDARGGRPDRADARLGRRQPRDDGPPRRRPLGPRRRQAVDRQRLGMRPDRRVGARRRRRRGRFRPGGAAGGRRLRRAGDHRQDEQPRGLADPHPPRRRAGAGRQPAGAGPDLRGHQPGAGGARGRRWPGRRSGTRWRPTRGR